MQRAIRGCTRSDLPAVEWDPSDGRTQALLCFHLGLPADRSWKPPKGMPVAPDQWKRPIEDPADGCPGGDQRSRLHLEVLGEYYRRRDANGNRVPNPRFDRVTDDVLLDAVMYCEQHEDMCLAQVEVEEADRRRREAKAGGT